MSPHSGLSAPPTTSSTLPIDIRRFPWVRRLAADYAHEPARLAEFFAGHPSDLEAWRQAIARVQHHARPRIAVADLIQAQQQRRHAPAEAVAAAARLRDPRTVAVVTGQQAGLFGGPLFTLLKALTALQRAAQVQAQHGVPAVAVFWIDAEDHDWEEVRSCHVLDADLALRTVALEQPPGVDGTAIGRIRLDDSVLTALDALEPILQPTEFRADVLAGLRHAYQPDTGMAEAFGRWLESLLGPRGLVVHDASDPAAKPLVADLFAREVEHAGETWRLAGDAGLSLQARGYHIQVPPQPGAIALFHQRNGRAPIGVRDGAFVLGDQTVSAADLLARVRQAPGEFSPNVLLRPLVQDTLFPTICYVSGPSELAYLAQLKGVYGAFGIPMPLIEQRMTATCLDSGAMRFLTRQSLPIERLRAQDEAALNALISAQLPPGVDETLDRTLRMLETEMLALAGTVTQIDPTVEGATRATLTRMQDDLRKLQGKIVQAAKRKDETLRRQFRHAQAQAFPAGHPQERQIGQIYFLNRYGPALLDRVSALWPGQPGTHYVLTV